MNDIPYPSDEPPSMRDAVYCVHCMFKIRDDETAVRTDHGWYHADCASACGINDK